MDMLFFQCWASWQTSAWELKVKFADPAEMVEKLYKYSYWTDTKHLSAPENICVYMKECCHWNTSSYLHIFVKWRNSFWISQLPGVILVCVGFYPI